MPGQPSLLRTARRPAPTAEPHLVHGMGLDEVAPDWPPLEHDEVTALLRHYPSLGALISLDWHSPRPFSAAALATTATGEWFIKRHHRAVRDRAGLREEHRFIAHLQRHGVPVAEIMSTGNGDSVGMSGDWSFEVHRRAQGSDLYRDAMSWTAFLAPQHAFAAGAAMARLHLASASYRAPPRRAQVLVSSVHILAASDALPALEGFIAARPALGQFLHARDWRGDVGRGFLPLHAAFRVFLPDLPPVWTHNDWHASNLLWSGSGDQASVQTVLDFGLADRSFAVHDLAVAIERNAIEWLKLPQQTAGLVHFDLIDALIQGYQAVRPLSDAEAGALIALLPICHVEFALSEAGYFSGVLQSEDKSSLAYDGYLLGHIDWFQSAHGQELIRFMQELLQRRAE